MASHFLMRPSAAKTASHCLMRPSAAKLASHFLCGLRPQMTFREVMTSRDVMTSWDVMTCTDVICGRRPHKKWDAIFAAEGRIRKWDAIFAAEGRIRKWDAIFISLLRRQKSNNMKKYREIRKILDNYYKSFENL